MNVSVNPTEAFSDKIYYSEEIDPETGKPTRFEMDDVSDQYTDILGEQKGIIAAFLYHSCSNPSQAFPGYSVMDFEAHCTTFRVVAKLVSEGEQFLFETPTYNVIAVYQLTT